MLKNTNTQTRAEVFSRIYIQEYLRKHRTGEIINAICAQYITSAPTVRRLIRPATLKAEIKAGKYEIDNTYISILQ